jgi:hypothetical protein
MKNTLTYSLAVVTLVGAILASSFAFNTPVAEKEYMTMTVIESIIPAGIGRSRILIDNGGKMEELKINNFYSAVGINMGNIYDNDVMVSSKINAFAAEGWVLDFVNTGVQSPTDGGKSGIFCTRYIFSRVR